LNKVATTYWDNSMPRLNSRAKTQTRAKTNRESATPQWFVFAVIVFITFMMCLAINFRAFSELGTETQQNQRLTAEVEQLTNQNTAIQEEIKSLKSDPKMIEREARKLGMGRSNEKIFVPTN
jgi:cell division protein FtsB